MAKNFYHPPVVEVLLLVQEQSVLAGSDPASSGNARMEEPEDGGYYGDQF